MCVERGVYLVIHDHLQNETKKNKTEVKQKETHTAVFGDVWALGVTSMSCVKAMTSRAAVSAPPKPGAAFAA